MHQKMNLGPTVQLWPVVPDSVMALDAPLAPSRVPGVEQTLSKWLLN